MKRRWFNTFLIIAGLALIVLLFFAIKAGPTGRVVADTSSEDLHNFTVGANPYDLSMTSYGLLYNGDLIYFEVRDDPQAYSETEVYLVDVSKGVQDYATLVSPSEAVVNIGGLNHTLSYGNGWVLFNNATKITNTFGSNISVGDYLPLDLSLGHVNLQILRLIEVYNGENKSQDYVMFTDGFGNLIPAMPITDTNNEATLTVNNYQVNVTYGGNGLNGWAIVSNKTVYSNCMDTDGGKNYYLQGNVYGSFPRGDVCLSAKTLMEFYCDSGEWTNINYVCPEGCYKGACLGGPLNYSYSPLTSNAGSPLVSSSNVNEIQTSITPNNESENQTPHNESSTLYNETIPFTNQTSEPKLQTQNFSLFLGSSTVMDIGGTSYNLKLTNLTEDKATVTVNGLIHYTAKLGESFNLQGFKITVVNIILNDSFGVPFAEVSVAGANGVNLSDYGISINGPTLVDGKLTCTSGCLYSNGCLDYGARQGNQYCASDGNMKDQLGTNIVCQNNFECASNVCSDEKTCTPQGLVDRIVQWLRSLFGLQ